MGWGHGLSGRALAWLPQSPEFNAQYRKKKKGKILSELVCIHKTELTISALL
jgi:hypothetical protein